jgi:hypothetical protein
MSSVEQGMSTTFDIRNSSLDIRHLLSLRYSAFSAENANGAPRVVHRTKLIELIGRTPCCSFSFASKENEPKETEGMCACFCVYEVHEGWCGMQVGTSKRGPKKMLPIAHAGSRPLFWDATLTSPL